MPQDIPDWVYPGSQVWQPGNTDERWTISALTLSDDGGRVIAVLRRESGGRLLKTSLPVTALVAKYASESSDGAVSSPLETSEVIVIPADWSAAPARWDVQAIIVSDGIRLVLNNPREAHPGLPREGEPEA